MKPTAPARAGWESGRGEAGGGGPPAGGGAQLRAGDPEERSDATPGPAVLPARVRETSAARRREVDFRKARDGVIAIEASGGRGGQGEGTPPLSLFSITRRQVPASPPLATPHRPSPASPTTMSAPLAVSRLATLASRSASTSLPSTSLSTASAGIGAVAASSTSSASTVASSPARAFASKAPAAAPKRVGCPPWRHAFKQARWNPAHASAASF